jgi:hypothetical protein
MEYLMPNKPISVTRITADTPPVRVYKDYTLTLEIPLMVKGGLEDAEMFEKHLRYVFQDYRDGRKPFWVEMLEDGLFRCLKAAFRTVLETFMQRKYGHEMVPSASGNGATAKWCIEADKAMRTANMPYMSGAEIEVKVREKK